MLSFGAVSESAISELPSAGSGPSTVTGTGDATLSYSDIALGFEAAALALHFKRVVASTRGRWADSAALDTVVRAVYAEAPPPRDRATSAPWTVGVPSDKAGSSPWGVSAAKDRTQHSSWAVYERYLQPVSLSPWGHSRPVDEASSAPWGVYERRLDVASFEAWVASKPADSASRAPWLQVGPLVVMGRSARYATAKPADRLRWIPWTKYSRTLTLGVGAVSPSGDPNEPLFVIPVKEVYTMINVVTLVRVDTGQALKAVGFTLALDVDSWTWTFNAGIDASQLDVVKRVEPNVPVELEATINGWPVRVLAEDISRQRTFGNAELTVSGRGISAVLGQPFAPVLNFSNDAARTAQQLAGDVLTFNEVPLGWELDWQMADWLVPANTWYTQGRYMEALNEIANAAGGYVQPHPTDLTLKFLKRYPALPWDWATTPPDYELPSAVVTVEGLTWRSKPAYNRVFVYGMQGGAGVQATRAGSAGDVLAPMVTDALVTHVDAGRGRAEAILADTGEQTDVRLRVPVFGDVGLILPGSLVKYMDGEEVRYGLARAIQVEASPSESWQTIELETHDDA